MQEAKSSAHGLVSVPFHGDVIEATKDHAGNVWVPIKRPCESLGVDPKSQRDKLQGKPWAVGVMIPSTGPDGKRYEMYAIHLDCLPMWLATIEASRVKPELRAKLEAYQKDAARVLADHFLGRREAPPALDLQQLVNAISHGVVAGLREAMPAVRPAGRLWTVQERCREMWPGSNARQRRRVRDIAVGLMLVHYGERPIKRGDEPNAELVWDQERLPILDRAIRRAQQEEDGGDTLFLTS